MNKSIFSSYYCPDNILIRSPVPPASKLFPPKRQGGDISKEWTMARYVVVWLFSFVIQFKYKPVMYFTLSSFVINYCHSFIIWQQKVTIALHNSCSVMKFVYWFTSLIITWSDTMCFEWNSIHLKEFILLTSCIWYIVINHYLNLNSTNTCK